MFSKLFYALPAINQEDCDSAHDEIPSWKRQSRLSSQGNAQHDKAADIELEHNEENAVDVESAPVELDRWQET